MATRPKSIATIGRRHGQDREDPDRDAEGTSYLAEGLDMLGTAAERLPGALEASVSQVRATSTVGLLLATAFSAGLGLGLLVGRAPRSLVALALGPVAVFGGVLLGRQTAELSARSSER